jgi:pimeloyl-ACP methyl ester carboxylesterase
MESNADYEAYLISYTSYGLTVSGKLSLPKNKPLKGIVLMLRGHQERDGYHTGKGTEYPARAYLSAGFATIAPDFFGFGQSSAVPSPQMAEQLFFTINAIELYKSLQNPQFIFANRALQLSFEALPKQLSPVVLWGHSNGGQLAIHLLQITGLPIATLLWAPVTLPFPDSLVFYRPQIAGWANDFKKGAGGDDFSLFNFMPRIAPNTPLRIVQGDADTSVPAHYTETFVKAIEAENNRRKTEGIAPIKLSYKLYKQANHNLEPYWNELLPADVAFWVTSLANNKMQ